MNSEAALGAISRMLPYLMTCQEVLEHAVAHRQSYLPNLALWRDGEYPPIAMAVAPPANGKEPIDLLEEHVARLAGAFDADLAVVVADAWHGPILNPATGEPWADGEMDVVATLNTKENPLEESLTVYAAARVPDVVLAITAMHYRREGRKVHWSKGIDLSTLAATDSAAQGRTAKIMRGAFDGPRLHKPDPVERHYLDMVLCDFYGNKGLQIRLFDIGSES